MAVERLFGLSAEGVASNAPPGDAKGLPCSLIVFKLQVVARVLLAPLSGESLPGRASSPTKQRTWARRWKHHSMLSGGLTQPAPQTQPRDASVWNDVEPDMTDRAQVHQFAGKKMRPVHLKLLLSKQGRPEHRLRDQ